MDFHRAWVSAARDRLIDAGLCSGNVLTEKERPTRDDDLPMAHVSVGLDRLSPAGDRRTGPLDFIHTTVLGVEVEDHDNALVGLNNKLAAHAQLIASTLFPDFYDWAEDAEGVDGVTITYDYPPKGERIVGRVTVVIEILSRSTWKPATAALADLETVSIDAGNGIGSSVPVPTT